MKNSSPVTFEVTLVVMNNTIVPIHQSIRMNSSKEPGKTRSSLAITQRRPNTTIPGILQVNSGDLSLRMASPLHSGQASLEQHKVHVMHDFTDKATANPAGNDLHPLVSHQNSSVA